MMKVRLLRRARIWHEAGETLTVSPAEGNFLLSVGSAAPVKEKKAKAPKKEEKIAAAAEKEEKIAAAAEEEEKIAAAAEEEEGTPSVSSAESSVEEGA